MDSTGFEKLSGGARVPRAITVVVAIMLTAGSSGHVSAQEQNGPRVEDLTSLSWLVGSWGDEKTLEHWTDGQGGLMLGVHRDLRDGRASFFEFLRIALTRDGGIVYLASPAGRHPPTVFPAVALERDRVVFANPEHDYPQRIEYSLEDGALIVTISNADQSNQRTWRWRRLDPSP